MKLKQKIWTELLQKKWDGDINRASQIKFLKKKKEKAEAAIFPMLHVSKTSKKKVDKYFADYFVSEDLTKRAVAFSFKNISTM